MDNGQLTAHEARLVGTLLLDRMFVSLPQQLDNVRRWNEERRWGFSATDLDSVDLTPTTESKSLVVDLIAVYLEGNAQLNGVRRTCHELWTLAAEWHPHVWCWDWYSDKWEDSPKPVRLREGIAHRPGIRRVTVDLGAHFEPDRYLRPSRAHGPESAHAEVLAVAAHFPRWIRAMDGKTVPYAWLSGYEVMIRERPSPERIPALSWSGLRRTVSLTAGWTNHAHSGWASPTCVS